MEENRDNVSAQERTSERNLRRRTRYAQMSPKRKQLFLSELREKRAESKRQKHLHQSNTTAALTINSSSLSPQEVEASEVTNLPVTLTTGHHQSNSTGALTINTSSLSPQQEDSSCCMCQDSTMETSNHLFVESEYATKVRDTTTEWIKVSLPTRGFKETVEMIKIKHWKSLKKQVIAAMWGGKQGIGNTSKECICSIQR